MIQHAVLLLSEDITAQNLKVIDGCAGGLLAVIAG